MRDRELQVTGDTTTHRSQLAGQHRTRSAEDQGRSSFQHDPLAEEIKWAGHATSVRAHAARLQRITAGQPARAGHPLLQLQRQYGNRHVQQVVALARQANGLMEPPGDIAQAIEQARGGGQPLESRIRTQMESAFDANFRTVRIHTSTEADTLNQALNARAFTTRQDIFFRQGEYAPGSGTGRELLAHELVHVLQQGAVPVQPNLKIDHPTDPSEQEARQIAREVTRNGIRTPETGHPEDHLPSVELFGVNHRTAATIQRDLARQPPGRLAPPPALSEEQVDEAIRFNNARYGPNVIRLIQDLVGAAQTGTFDADTIHMIVEWQADFRLTPDGKVGLQTVRTLVLELIAIRHFNSAIWLIIEGHRMSTRGLDSIQFDASLAGVNASTAGPIPGNSTVRIGPTAFAQGYAGLVHTIAHELEHVRQRRAGIANQNLREFLAEAIEIMSVGMFRESLAGFMDDAGRALFHWNSLPVAEQRANRDRFIQVRDRVRERFNAASAADRATHQATMNGYNAVVVPAP